VARKEDRRYAYRILVRRPEGNGPLDRSRRRWGDIKIDLHELGWRALDGLIWLRTGTGG
jgi:hypothetical protein